jgi:purine-binding chemotaxis protein CheW
MSSPLSASKKVMKNYLSELLTEEAPELAQQSIKTVNKSQDVVESTKLEALLQNVNAELDVAPSEVITRKATIPQPVIDSEKAEEEKVDLVLTTQKSSGGFIQKSPKSYRQGDFQALFFNVAGLTIAVPLIELGGIHKVDKTTSLMGKPDWFKGVMLYRDEKISVVDTALWVMPEKYDEKMKNSLNYQYIIMLSDSNWGLMAESLVDTVVLQQDEVKWLDSPSKRPWLAGLVKDKMCALLDVDALISLLNEGSGISQFD